MWNLNPTKTQVSDKPVTLKRADGDIYSYSFSNIPNQPSRITVRNTRTNDVTEVQCRGKMAPIGSGPNSGSGFNIMAAESGVPKDIVQFTDIYEIASNGRDVFVLTDGAWGNGAVGYVGKVVLDQSPNGCEFHRDTVVLAPLVGFMYLFLLPDSNGLALHLLTANGNWNFATNFGFLQKSSPSWTEKFKSLWEQL